ncbi:MAG: prepilin-type N-terminal cleavage/methylation domain-containing protein [Akkermansiaceae bacterium]|nr:prepilin-type N-terminal cleavage/methylation domain-containing protein [Akkermansiaceae bacterium]
MKASQQPQRRRSGFTLVEILVTLTIVAVLAGVVFSISAKAKQSALSASTLNNLREIGGCAGLWMSENNNFFPPAWDNTNGANRSYAQSFDPYMHGVPIYRSDRSKFIGPDKRIAVKVNSNSHPLTYAMNRAVCRDTTSNGKPGETLVHVTKVSQPTQVILLADGCQNPGNLGQSNASAYRLYAATGQFGPPGKGTQTIPIGPDVDTAAGDGWFRYPWGKCHALMCDGSAMVFAKGTIKNKNIWIDSDI